MFACCQLAWLADQTMLLLCECWRWHVNELESNIMYYMGALWWQSTRETPRCYCSKFNVVHLLRLLDGEHFGNVLASCFEVTVQVCRPSAICAWSRSLRSRQFAGEFLSSKLRFTIIIDALVLYSQESMVCLLCFSWKTLLLCQCLKPENSLCISVDFEWRFDELRPDVVGEETLGFSGYEHHASAHEV